MEEGEKVDRDRQGEWSRRTPSSGRATPAERAIRYEGAVQRWMGGAKESSSISSIASSVSDRDHGLDVWDAFFNMSLDAEGHGLCGHWASMAGTLQPNLDRLAIKLDELDVTTIHLKARTDLLDGCLDAFFHDFSPFSPRWEVLVKL